MRLAATPLALADIAPMAPSVAHDGTVRTSMRAQDAHEECVTARLGAGLGKGKVAVTASTHLDRGKPRGLRLMAPCSGSIPRHLSSAAPKGSINGTVDADLQGPLDSATGTANVRVTDSRIGTTPLKQSELHTELAGRRANVKVRGAASQAPSRSTAGSSRSIRFLPIASLGSIGPVAASPAAGSALTGVESDSMFDVRLTLAGRGVGAMTADLAGRLALFVVRQSGERLPVGHSTVALASGRVIARPELAVRGGKITATATAHLGDTITYRVI